MRYHFLAYISLGAFCATVVPSEASVVISDAATENMTCSGGTCYPTASYAVLNAAELQSLLASGNATVTTSGSGIQAGDIAVRAHLRWSTNSTLKLDAFRSIRLERSVAIAGTGAAALLINDGGSGGEFSCGGRGRLQFSDLSSALTINGAQYTLVNSVASLAAGVAANPSGTFALARDYDAEKDGTYASSPVPTAFSGSFNGLGNTISGLSINDPTENDYVGLFAETVAGSAISNIRVTNENVQGGSGSSVESSTEFIGGLIGFAPGGSVSHSFTSGTISGGDYAPIGGLIGVSGSTVTGSGSAAVVTASAHRDGTAGGLLGLSTSGGGVLDSYATGNVTGTGFVGGLIGFNSTPPIRHSWASGQVYGTDIWTTAGGLAGINEAGTMDRTWATGGVTCGADCGGLVGALGFGPSGTPKVLRSFATGSVTAEIGGYGTGGGLVGFNASGLIRDSYATGGVSALAAGGLVGENDGPGTVTVSRSYAAGAATGESGATGGLIGYEEAEGTALKHVYWDMTTSGISDPGDGAGNIANCPGIKGLSDSQFKAGLPRGLDPKQWVRMPTSTAGCPIFWRIRRPTRNGDVVLLNRRVIPAEAATTVV